MKNVNSTENQEIKRKFVNNEVIYNCNELISYLQQKEDHDYIDEVMQVSSAPDYENAAIDYLHNMENSDLYNLLDEYLLLSDSKLDNKYINKDESIEVIKNDKYMVKDYYNSVIDVLNKNSLLDDDQDALNRELILKDIEESKYFNHEEFRNEHNVDYDYKEAYEFYVVSDYLARKLQERGEMISFDIMGFTVWGRCTSGQAILLDSVISEICYDDLI